MLDRRDGTGETGRRESVSTSAGPTGEPPAQRHGGTAT